MILIFDLDDTLYEERSFVASGFRAVAKYLQEMYGLPQSETFFMMEQGLLKGRGRIFDNVLEHYNLASLRRARNCVAVYRAHKPTIRLYPEAEAFLGGLPKYYIVTDGNKLVQENKLRALGIYGDNCFLTYRFGQKNAKPSPYCFLKIMEKEGAEGRDLVYIGDNPEKDFIGIKPLGIRTVRLKMGMFRDVILSPEHEAEDTVSTWPELVGLLKERGYV